MNAKHKRVRAPERNSVEERITESLDELAEFREFKETLLPALRADLMKGTPAKEILEKVKSLAAARLGQIVVSELDSGKALAAIKDVLDRTDGKAKESIETTHKFQQMKDTDLDALLRSKLQESDADGIKKDDEQH